jgi:hypothetical protein
VKLSSATKESKSCLLKRSAIPCKNFTDPNVGKLSVSVHVVLKHLYKLHLEGLRLYAAKEMGNKYICKLSSNPSVRMAQSASVCIPVGAFTGDMKYIAWIQTKGLWSSFDETDIDRLYNGEPMDIQCYTDNEKPLVPHLLYRVAPKNAPELMLNT